MNRTRDLDAVVMRGAALPLSGARVLELGCGTGKNSAWLARESASLQALDFSDGMLAVARAAVIGDHVQFTQHDIREPWPAATNSMDVVVGNLVLEHVEQLQPVFSEAARVLAPGGTLFLCELHPYRQLRGSQAHFADQQSGDLVHVPAYVHTLTEYVNGGLKAGLVLEGVGEHIESEADAGALPRLLSVRFRAPV